MKSCYVLISVLIFFTLNTSAQQWQWSKQIGSYGSDIGKTATDQYGNLYVLGKYGDSFCYFNDTILPYNGSSVTFFAKYSPGGQMLWVHKINYGAFSFGSGNDLTIDRSNKIIITGGFNGMAIFGNDTLISSDPVTFLAKYTPDGECIWAIKSGGNFNGGVAVTTDDSHIYLAGGIYGTVSFDSVSLGQGGYLAKFDMNGSFNWVKQIYSGFYSLSSNAMKIINNKLYLSGTELEQSFNLDTIHISHPGKNGYFLSCFNTDGNIQWVKEGISRAAYSGFKIGTDNQKNIYVTGNFLDSIDFSGTILTATPAPFGTYGFFLAKYTSTGSLIYAKDVPVNYLQTHSAGESNSIITDSLGYFYLTGCFNGTAAFGPDTLVSATTRDMFLARFTPGGECLGAISFPNSSGISVDVDDSGNPMVTGVFNNQTTIGNISYSSYGNEDIFIAKCDRISGIENKSSKNQQLVIYANPNDGKCEIKIPQDFLNEKNLFLYIYNNNGDLIQNISLNNQEDNFRLDIRSEAKGFYNVILTNGKKLYSGKLIFE